VRPVLVVMALVLTKHGGGVPLVDDQEAVEEFAAEGADEAFGDGVGPRSSYRRLDDLDVGRGEHGVEGRGELGVAVADQELEATVGVIEIHAEVAGQLGQPGSGGVGGEAEDVDAAGGVLDDEERVEPVQGKGVDMQQVAGQDRVGLCAEELGPGRSGTAGCGVDPGGVQDRVGAENSVTASDQRVRRQPLPQPQPEPVGAENPVTSCDLQIFVYETAEPVSSQRPDGPRGGRGSAADGWLLSE
jgi:hypothetical protein